jgi:heat shock protein HslJ
LHIAAAAAAALVTAACASTPDGVAIGGPSSTSTTALAGTTWRLVSIDGRPALDDVRVTAVFASAEDRVAGTAGCNQYFGRAAVSGDRLEVGALGSTKMFCTASGVMPQEDAYLAALAKATVYRVAGRTLELGPSAGAVSLAFKAE